MKSPAGILALCLAGLFACASGNLPAAGQAQPTHAGCCSPDWVGLDEDIERHVELLRSPAGYSDSAVREGLEQYFSQAIERRRLTEWSALPDAGLAALFDAAYLIVFYTGSSAGVDRLQEIHLALQRRGVSTADHARKVVRSLVVGRRFDQARDLADQFRADVAVPTVIRADARPAAPSVFKVADSKTLVHESVDLAGVRLIVVGSPGCGFFRRAVADMSHDPSLAAWVQSHVLVLLPPLEPPDAGRLDQWNAQHPGLELHIPSRPDEWPWIARWSTPGFYLLVDGALRDHFIGWPDPDRLTRLRAMVRAGRGVIGPPVGR